MGELADGLYIDLDMVTKKYDGLDGTELAISESQERMAVAVAEADVEEFMGYALSLIHISYRGPLPRVRSYPLMILSIMWVS